ncbi:MAG: holo-ACP synthase [Pseudomonadota bacterium]
MIIGVGNDMVDIRRIEKTLERFGDRFTHRIYTELERQKAARRPNAAPTLAKRFAAKEACSKALGTGFRRGVFWRDMGVINLPTGQPTLKLSGGALLQLQSLIPENHSAQINLTLTDDFPWAQAIVIISANPTDNDATG